MSTAFRERWARHPAAFVFAAGLLVPLAYAPWRLSLVFFFSYAVLMSLATRTRDQRGRVCLIRWAFSVGQL